jgi:dihydroxy-acid dehydratase
MKRNRFPAGWNEDRVHSVLKHYNKQTADEAVAEDEAAFRVRRRPAIDDPYATAAKKYEPKGVTTILFVAESPPRSIDRYFYFEDVKRDDWLWIALMKGLYPPEWEREPTKTQRLRKKEWLVKFQESGFRLIDAVKEPICGKRVARIRSAAPELVKEIREIAPKQIVLIKASVHEALFEKFQNAGLTVVNDRHKPLPFPAAGWQNQFDKQFRQLIEDGKLMNPTSPNNSPNFRSRDWFGKRDRWGLGHRAWLRAEGFSERVFEGKPVIGVCNSWSELNNCNAHLRTVAEAVKRGVWEAGGFPLEFNTISLGEMLMKPTTMLYRNLMAMEVEECIRAYPLDGVVLLCGCDKTTPAQLMGAASVDVPAIMVPGGPMLSGMWHDRELAAGTDVRKMWEEVRAGRLGEEEYCEIESCVARSTGHCYVMGTASTMASLAEGLGMTLPGAADIPAADSRRMMIAEESGKRIVDMVREGLRPSHIMTSAALENTIRLLMALGGSTNAIVHLVAIAGRLGIKLPLSLFDEIAGTTPFIANVKPSGKFLMEEFSYAGGVPAVLKEISPLLHLDALTASGKSLGENLKRAACFNREVIRPLNEPLLPQGGVVVLNGNLAPLGAVIKQSAVSPHLMKHCGRAVVFQNNRDLLARLDDPNLPVDENSVMVLKNAGPKGAPGMPEWGHLPIPAKLLRAGVKDMVRLSDARISGTSFGTIVVHVAPEAAVGGPLAIVQDGDEIELDVAARRLELRVPDAEIKRRLSQWRAPAPHYTRGYGRLFLDHILQANEGCDFDFLRGADREDDGSPLARYPNPAL